MLYVFATIDLFIYVVFLLPSQGVFARMRGRLPGCFLSLIKFVCTGIVFNRELIWLKFANRPKYSKQNKTKHQYKSIIFPCIITVMCIVNRISNKN